MITQEYFLDMIPGESTPPVVHVSQFDVNSRTLTFNLMKGGVAFVPDAGMSVTLDGMKPDNHVFSYPMTVNGSSVSIDVLTQMTVVSGHVRCEVSVSNQNGKIGSANFILAVEESPIDSGSISESDIPIFEDLKNQAQQAAADAEQSASDAETAATSVSAMMATVESTSIASKAYSVGDYLVLNGKLYEVTRAIIRGGRLTVGTNISETTVGGELTSLNSNLTSLEDEVDSIGTATSIEDTEPYLFKSSARENVVGNIMSVHKIIGGTVAWNQLAGLRQTEYTPGSIGVTYTPISISTFRLHGEITAINDIYLSAMPGYVADISGHKYIAWVNGENSASEYFKFHQGSKYYPNIFNKPYIYQYSPDSARVNDIETIKTGEVDFTFHWNKIDLTQMFGSTIADYIYFLEQAAEGAGVEFFRNLFPNDYYAFNAGELISVKTSAHVMRDANNNIIGNYALDTGLELRGIPKIADGKLYYDGDKYEPSGTVTRKYEKRAYQSGDESLADAITDRTNTVVKLATPTTETADAYDKQQVFDVTGTEEYVDTRTVPIPVGHDTFFPTSLTSRIDALEDEFNEEITVLSESIAPTETGTATQNYAAGSCLMLNNRLCKVTAAIATGEQIIVGSNVQYTTVAEELTAILAQINA